MAAALLTHLAGDRIEVRSAGTEPADQINPVAVAAMAELGIDITAATLKVLTGDAVQNSDLVITMGCGDILPLLPRRVLPRLETARPRRPTPRHRALHPRRHRRPNPSPDHRTTAHHSERPVRQVATPHRHRTRTQAWAWAKIRALTGAEAPDETQSPSLTKLPTECTLRSSAPPGPLPPAARSLWLKEYRSFPITTLCQFGRRFAGGYGYRRCGCADEAGRGGRRRRGVGGARGFVWQLWAAVPGDQWAAQRFRSGYAGIVGGCQWLLQR